MKLYYGCLFGALIGTAAMPAARAVDCAQLEADSTSRLMAIQRQVEATDSMCHTYRLAEQTGRIAVEMYSSCPILDPDGMLLDAARQMITDAQSGQRQVCTR